MIKVLRRVFYAIRLPYGEQQDEDDAQQALTFITPDEVLTINVKPASDALLTSLEEGGLVFQDAAHRDFVLGNIKARQRMVAQYAIAGAHAGLVVGTDQAAEALMGFLPSTVMAPAIWHRSQGLRKARSEISVTP